MLQLLVGDKRQGGMADGRLGCLVTEQCVVVEEQVIPLTATR